MSQPSPRTGRPRIRKAHRKSRYGCANCKIRRVKCDEEKPTCQKCVSYGLGCSYEAGISEMQLAFTGAFKLDLTPGSTTRVPIPKTLPPPPMCLPLAGPMGGGTYEMKPCDQAILGTFQTNNILTVGPASESLLFQQRIVRHAVSNPFLVHMVLAVTLIHDLHHGRVFDRKKAAMALAFHFSHGTTLFNRKLSGPVEATEANALWLAAALTATKAFADVRGSSVEGTWPLSPPSFDDLDWLKLTGGKQAVLNICAPTEAAKTFKGFLQPTSRVGPEILNLPPLFIELYGLDEHSTPANNPYHAAATVLAQIMPLEIERPNAAKFLSFAGFPDPRYVCLLEARDPLAMLLLAYWYAKVFTADQWWLWRRARLEGPAICRFLEREFKGNPDLLLLLAFPRAVFFPCVQEEKGEYHNDKYSIGDRPDLPDAVSSDG
ncbi:hypothetical protein OQA88_3069 [Cercophora sp. LCS_1]